MGKPAVELAMIVRNGGAGLARAIRSALPAVDRVIVGNTGSTDDSAAIARSFGARVFDVPWENDFSKARNAVLQACRGEWILLLDADEMLDPAGASQIPRLAMQTRVEAWEVWKWNYIRTLTSRSGVEPARPNPNILEESRPYPAYTQSLNTLFFRRRPDLYFEYEVHETVSKRARELRLNVAEAPFVIHHFGYAEDTDRQRQQKLERYHQMGIRKAQTYPQDYWAHYELGLSEFEYRHNPQRALLSFETALRLNPEFHGAWLYAGICLTRLERFAPALEYLHRAEEEGHPNALLDEARGDVFFHSGDFAQAAHQYRLCGRHAGLSPLAACKLGACEVRQGQAADGLARIQAAVEREPQAVELYDIWIAAALLCGDAQTAAKVAERQLRVGLPSVESFVVAAGLQARLKRWDRAAAILVEGMQQYPDNTKLRREWEVALDRAGLAKPEQPRPADPAG